jgi:integrase
MTKKRKGPTMPVRRARLTKRTVDALKPESVRYTVWDDKDTGFGVRIASTGAKTFIVRYRHGNHRGGILRQANLGTLGAAGYTADRARADAIEILRQRRLDPLGERRREREDLTLRELAEQFLVDAELRDRTRKFYKWELNKYVLPRFGNRKISTLRREDFKKLHRQMKDTPIQANRILTVIASLYKWAGKNEILPPGSSPVRHIEKWPENAIERYLNTDELGRLGDALRLAETEGFPRNQREDKRAPKDAPQRDVLSPYAIAAIRLLIFTGCRLSEILTLKWDFLDRERGQLLLPTSKTGKKTITLSPPALAALASLPPVEGNPYVIVGTAEGQHLANLHRPWNAIRKCAGLEDVRIHDLRHSFASTGLGANMALHMIGKLLGHSSPASTARYAHLSDDARRKAVDTIGSTIAAAMGELPAARGEVLPMGRKA